MNFIRTLHKDARYFFYVMEIPPNFLSHKKMRPKRRTHLAHFVQEENVFDFHLLKRYDVYL